MNSQDAYGGLSQGYQQFNPTNNNNINNPPPVNKPKAKQYQYQQEKPQMQNQNLLGLDDRFDGLGLKQGFEIQSWKNKYTDDVLGFIQMNKQSGLQEQKKEMRRQIKLKFFSSQNIEREIQQIAMSLFYFPSVQLATQIQQMFNNQVSYEDILFKSVVFRHGDLFKIRSSTAEAKHVMKNVRNWGRYYFDVIKLQRFAFKKSGDAEKRQYQIPQYQLLVTITPNEIEVSHNGKIIQPSDFRQDVMRKLAVDKIKKVASQIYFKFLRTKQ